jgi:nitrite reductase (NADH) large subunit
VTTYLIVGNGVAGNTAAENIRQIDPRGDIFIFCKGRHYFYYTPALPDYLAGEKEIKNFTIHDEDWYAQRGIELRRETEITSIDPGKHIALTSKGETYPYDRILLACGGKSFVPPIPGSASAGVFTLRTVDDADAIRKWAKEARKAVLIGGGLLGLEAGNGLRKLGLEVSVIEVFPRLLPRQMDIPGAGILQKQMEAMGFRFYLGKKTREIASGKDRLEVRLESGEKCEADLVLVSAGVRPETTLAKALGLAVDKGVKVDDTMKTSGDKIFAAGDLIEHQGRFYGIWPASREQGRIAGLNMAGQKTEYHGTVPSNDLKVVGIDLVATGEIDGEGRKESITRQSAKTYRKLVVEDNRIIGAIFLGDTEGSEEIQKAIQTGRDISSLKKDLAHEHFDFRRLQEG